MLDDHYVEIIAKLLKIEIKITSQFSRTIHKNFYDDFVTQVFALVKTRTGTLCPMRIVV
jgi:hypothetical protein